jgi:hypothetical protein
MTLFDDSHGGLKSAVLVHVDLADLVFIRVPFVVIAFFAREPCRLFDAHGPNGGGCFLRKSVNFSCVERHGVAVVPCLRMIAGLFWDIVIYYLIV